MAAGPRNLTAPIGVVTIQVQLAPVLEDGASEEGKKAAWTVLPCHLVFGKKHTPAAHAGRGDAPADPMPIDGVVRAHGQFNTRADEVMDAWTHVRAGQSWAGVRCLGVALAHIPADTPVEENPGVGRFSVAVSGAVNIACNRELLTDALPGDILYWEKKPAGIQYIGAPAGHRSATIRCAVTKDSGDDRTEYLDNNVAVRASLAHDPIALAFLLKPDQRQMTYEKAARIIEADSVGTVGGRIGRLLALGPEGTNECRVLLDL